MSEPVIRPVRPSDVASIEEIAVAAWEPVFAGFGEAMGEEMLRATRGDWREEKARQVRTACQERPGQAFVAEDPETGRVAGFVTFHVTERPTKLGEIGNNAVHPDFQGRGIATRLYGRVLERLRELGCTHAKVSTGGDEAHAPARRAYEKAGFSVMIPHVTYWMEL